MVLITILIIIFYVYRRFIYRKPNITNINNYINLNIKLETNQISNGYFNSHIKKLLENKHVNRLVFPLHGTYEFNIKDFEALGDIAGMVFNLKIKLKNF